MSDHLSGGEYQALENYRELVKLARGVMTADMLAHMEHGSVDLIDISDDLKKMPVPKSKALSLISLAVAEAFGQIEIEKQARG